MRVETYYKGKKWYYRVMKGRHIIGKSRRGYSTKDEANTVGQNHKQAVAARVSPVTGR